MAFGVLMGQIAVIFLEVMLGYAGARCGVITDRDSRFLSDFIMKLLLPCTMLAGAAIDDEPEIVLQAGVLFVLLLALFVVTTGLCRLSSWLHHDTPGKYAVLVGTAAMPNCGFIGLPLQCRDIDSREDLDFGAGGTMCILTSLLHQTAVGFRLQGKHIAAGDQFSEGAPLDLYGAVGKVDAGDEPFQTGKALREFAQQDGGVFSGLFTLLHQDIIV